jgi:hypothetical protein
VEEAVALAKLRAGNYLETPEGRWEVHQGAQVIGSSHSVTQSLLVMVVEAAARRKKTKGLF